MAILPVKVYKSSDYGAPVMDYQAGSLNALLEACLVNGYNPVSVVSIARIGSIATVTTDGAHNYNVYDVVALAGADQADYNGEFRVVSVLNSTQFTVEVQNAPATPATGTITVKRPGAGWTKPYSGGDTACFRTAGHGRYLQVDDSGHVVSTNYYYALVTGYETMSSYDSGSNPFYYTVSGSAWRKRVGVTNFASCNWVLIADDRFFYLLNEVNAASYSGAYEMVFFGEFPSYKSGDLYNCILNANNAASLTSAPNIGCSSTQVSTTAMTASHFVNRLSDNVTVNHAVGKYCNNLHQPYLGGTTVGNFNGGSNWIDNGIHFAAPVLIIEPAAGFTVMDGIRGYLPGLFNPLCNKPGAHLDTYDGVPGLPGHRLLNLAARISATQGGVAIDITGPWR
jgi:hypothetical protein